MDQYYNNSQNEFLWKLLANPADDAHLYAYDLQRLVNDFPQSGVLHALLAHASDDKNLRQASVYFNARSLYKLINAPSTFVGVPDERIIIQNSIGANGHYRYAEPPIYENSASFHEENTDTNAAETYWNGNTASETVTEELTAHEPAVHEETHAPTAIDEQYLTETGHHVVENESVEAPVEHQVTEADETFSRPLETADQNRENESVEAPVEHQVTEADETSLPSLETTHQIQESEAVAEPFEDKAEETHEATPPPVETAYQNQEIDAIEVPADHKNEEVHEVVAPIAENIPVENEPERHETAFQDMPAVPQEHELVNNEPVAVEHHIEDHHEEAKEEEQKASAVETPEEQPEKYIADDEVFDEIVSIEQINIDSGNKPQTTGETYPGEEELIKGSIASSDFFAFDKTFGEHKPKEQEEISGPDELKTSAAGDTEHQDVSKYHDEKMPYTFMWWLDKTRKEYAATYQPYIKQGTTTSTTNRPKKPADELQQQYFENIFHITSVEELDKSTPPPAAPHAMKPKEHTIIERFIKEEPQIRPQSSEKIDNENKAKKSSEDRDELVTETLAAIYSDQMLYHKAIASYKKLMLKFPEKSRYFADKIEQLEKKTN